MAGVERAITCAFMRQSISHTRVGPWRKPVSFLQLQACRSSRVGNGNFGIVAVSLRINFARAELTSGLSLRRGGSCAVSHLSFSEFSHLISERF